MTVAGPELRRARVGEIRPGERQREQHQRQRAQRQQQPLTQPAAARLLDRRTPQEPHRAERHDRLGLPPEQVNDDRHRRGGEADQEEWGEESQVHASSFTALLAAAANGQIGQERAIEGLAGVEQLVVDPDRAQLAPVRVDEAADAREVLVAHFRRRGNDLLVGLEIPKP